MATTAASETITVDFMWGSFAMGRVFSTFLPLEGQARFALPEDRAKRRHADRQSAAAARSHRALTASPPKSSSGRISCSISTSPRASPAPRVRSPDHTIIEVGPGPGGLTRALLAEGARKVIAIERDERTLPALAEISAAYPGRLEVISGDALEIDYRALADGPRVSSPTCPTISARRC
jgi:hypothetical protein